MVKLETQVNDISSQVTLMTNQISKTVIATLTADDGIIKRQERKMDKMVAIIIKMAASIQELLKQRSTRDIALRVASPPRSIRESEKSTDGTSSEGCPSPDRQR
jgi:hypothetical protein